MRKSHSGEFSQPQSELSPFLVCACIFTHLVAQQTFDGIDGGLGLRSYYSLPKLLMKSQTLAVGA